MLVRSRFLFFYCCRLSRFLIHPHYALSNPPPPTTPLTALAGAYFSLLRSDELGWRARYVLAALGEFVKLRGALEQPY